MKKLNSLLAAIRHERAQMLPDKEKKEAPNMEKKPMYVLRRIHKPRHLKPAHVLPRAGNG